LGGWAITATVRAITAAVRTPVAVAITICQAAVAVAITSCQAGVAVASRPSGSLPAVVPDAPTPPPTSKILKLQNHTKIAQLYFISQNTHWSLRYKTIILNSLCPYLMSPGCPSARHRCPTPRRCRGGLLMPKK
jgi:hypothetical protein